MFEGWGAGEVIFLVAVLGFFAYLLVPYFNAGVAILHGYVYAVQDRWIDRTRNSISDKVDSDTSKD